MTLQNSLANLSFLTLLGSMIFYWIETSFHDLNLVAFFSGSQVNSPEETNGKINSGLLRTSKPILDSFISTESEDKLKSESAAPKSLANYMVLLSNILLGLLLLLRWKESGHFPLSNLYESLMFLSWCFTSLHLYIDNYTSLPKLVSFSASAAVPSATSKAVLKQAFQKQSENNELSSLVWRSQRKLIGSITTPSALLTNAFATFTLPKEMQEASPLVPALQSNWLMMHVTVMILSYAALILGSLLSIAFLIITIPNNSVTPPPNKGALADLSSLGSSEPLSQTSPFGGGTPEGGGKDQRERASARLQKSFGESTISPNSLNMGFDNESSLSQESINIRISQSTVSTGINSSIAFLLDNLSYRILGIGFPLLTIGILSGAVWANEAWGSYWSWDPKETWALLTWLIFAIYLHTRLSKGWEGKKPAIIASFGFVIVWMCYLGVNLIGEGLHSYGWIS